MKKSIRTHALQFILILGILFSLVLPASVGNSAQDLQNEDTQVSYETVAPQETETTPVADELQISPRGDAAPTEVEGVNPDIMPLMEDIEEIGADIYNTTTAVRTPDFWYGLIVVVGSIVLILMLRKRK